MLLKQSPGLLTPHVFKYWEYDGEGIIDDIIMHSRLRHLWKKKRAKKMLLELYHLT